MDEHLWSGTSFSYLLTLIQTKRTYFQYIDILFQLLSVDKFHDNIDNQHDPGFHLRSYMKFFMDRYYESNVLDVVSLSGLIGVADRVVNPLPASTRGILPHSAVNCLRCDFNGVMLTYTS